MQSLQEGHSLGQGGLLGALQRPFHSFWANRHLYRRVLVRDIESSFRGSALGLAWIVLIPLVLVAIYTFVFGVVLSATFTLPTRRPFEVPLVYFTGLTIFAFFMEVISRSPNYVRENSIYVKKILFPLDILAWVLAGTALFKFLINFGLVLVLLLLITGGIPAKALLMPVLLLPFVAMTIGLSWALSALGTFVRDLPHAISALAPIIMFVSPIFYAVRQVPEPFAQFYYLNPLTFVLESARGLLFFDQTFSLTGYAIFCAVALAVFMAGYALFQRVRPGFADVI